MFRIGEKDPCCRTSRHELRDAEHGPRVPAELPDAPVFGATVLGYHRYPMLVLGAEGDEVRDERVAYISDVVAQLLHDFSDSKSVFVDDKP